MIKYMCPGFYDYQPIYKTLFWLFDEHSECFRDNVCIDKIYGCFPGMTWNGGGVSIGGVDYETVRDVFNWYADRNITLQLTCTNPCLEEIDNYDRYGNMILKLASEYNNIEVLVSSPILEKYIRKTYPSLKIDKSIVGNTKNRYTLTSEDYIQEAKEYNCFVIPRQHGKDFSILKKIPIEIRNKTEILCTDPCSIHCPRLYSHYEDLGKNQLFLTNDSKIGCTNLSIETTPFGSIKYRNYNITYDEICEKYLPLGYEHFKLSGRGSMPVMVFNVSQYMFKPEYMIAGMQVLMDFLYDYKCGLDLT